MSAHVRPRLAPDPQPEVGARPTHRLKLTLLLWLVYLLLTPLYFRSSGNVQIADYALAATLAVHLLSSDSGRQLLVPPQSRRSIQALAAFVLLTVVVNTAWVGLYGSWGPLTFSSFYFYGFLVVIIVALLVQRFGPRLYATTRLGVLLALFFLAGLVLLDQEQGLRVSGTFNNPNQLGFFALLGQSVLWVCNTVGQSPRSTRAIRRHLLLEGFGWVATLLIVLASASLGAFVGVSVLLLANLVVRWRAASWITVGVAAALLFGGFTATASGQFESVQDRYDRFEYRTGGTAEGLLAERGYDRIGSYPHHILLGAGEGEFNRFGSTGFTGELHSSPGTLLFSYGVLGLGLFALFLSRAVRNAGWRASLPLLPILIYTLTHNGLRFRLWWVFLGLLVAAPTVLPRKHRAGPADDERPAKPDSVTSPSGSRTAMSDAPPTAVARVRVPDRRR